MMDGNEATIADYFENLQDPRKVNKRHKLIDIITITISAVICGAEAWEQVEEFGKAKKDWFDTFLELPHGIPSHDTFGRVFRALDPVEFRSRFSDWIKSVSRLTKGEVVAIDGKTLRRSHDKSDGKSAIHMISAWASKNSLVLGQLKTEEKSNEITAIPQLLKTLEISGCIVTIDAMGCQKKIAHAIVEKDADYLLALKGNQGNLHDDVALFFKDCVENGFGDVPYDFTEVVDGGHGRVEVRRCWTTSSIEWLCDKEAWKDLRTIAMVERERHIGDKVSVESAFYISCLPSDAGIIEKAARSHWGVENSLHWVLDVTFREDDCRMRKGNSAENFAVLRHIALNLLKKASAGKGSMKTKRLKAGWDNEYLGKVLAG